MPQRDQPCYFDLARCRSARSTVGSRYTQTRMPRVPLIVWVLPVMVLCACAEPPSKEMNQAQGAIDAAKAAGAEAFAPMEFTAAVDALRHSEEAAAQRDYRQALS